MKIIDTIRILMTFNFNTPHFAFLACYINNVFTLWLFYFTKQRHLAVIFALVGAALINWINFLSPQIGYDFYTGYYPAIQNALNGKELYQIGSNGIIMGTFVNLPILATILSPLGRLSAHTAFYVFSFISFISAAYGALVLAQLFKTQSSQRFHHSTLVLILLNSPIWYGLCLGNLSLLAFAIFCVFLGELYKTKPSGSYYSGIMLSALILLKPVFLPIMIPVLYLRYWKTFLIASAGFGVALFLSYLTSGTAEIILWWNSCILQFRNYFIASYPSQSFMSTTYRFLELDSLESSISLLTHWEKIKTPPWLGLLNMVLFSLMALWVFARFRKIQSGYRMNLIQELTVWALLAVLFAPVSWSHYYFVSIPALLSASVSMGGKQRHLLSQRLLLLVTASLLSMPLADWLYLEICRRENSMLLTSYLAFFTSMHFWAGVGLFYLLYFGRNATRGKTRKFPVIFGPQIGGASKSCPRL